MAHKEVVVMTKNRFRHIYNLLDILKKAKDLNGIIMPLNMIYQIKK